MALLNLNANLLKIFTYEPLFTINHRGWPP